MNHSFVATLISLSSSSKWSWDKYDQLIITSLTYALDHLNTLLFLLVKKKWVRKFLLFTCVSAMLGIISCTDSYSPGEADHIVKMKSDSLKSIFDSTIRPIAFTGIIYKQDSWESYCPPGRCIGHTFSVKILSDNGIYVRHKYLVITPDKEGFVFAHYAPDLELVNLGDTLRKDSGSVDIEIISLDGRHYTSGFVSLFAYKGNTIADPVRLKP